MKKSILSFLGISSFFVFGKQPCTSVSEGESIHNNDYLEQNENIVNIEISHAPEFAGLPVPMSNPVVKRRFYIELTTAKYWRYIAANLTVKADRFFPEVEPVLKKYGIPDDFKYIPIMESGFGNKVSASGAAGPWQLMPETAKHYGLIVNSQVDERFNVERSTEAACKYLYHLHHQLHDWTLAAAAYNKGLDGVKNAVEKQKTKSYYKLKLNQQAQVYVYRILAAKEVILNPSKYGYLSRTAHFHYSIPTFRIRINNSISNLALFAKKHGISIHTLRAYNPWLRANSFDNPKRRICYLEIPMLNEISPAHLHRI